MRFRSDPSSLRGSIAPVVTPFTDDGQLDLACCAAGDHPGFRAFLSRAAAPVKWVLRQAGLLGSAHVRPPLAGVSGAGQVRIADLLRAGSSALSPPISDALEDARVPRSGTEGS